MHRKGTNIKSLRNRAYFFDRGLRFGCQQCGACCTGAPGTIYVSPDEIVSIAAHLQIRPRDLMDQFLYPYQDSHSIREDERGHCRFYLDGCAIYPARPFQCRSFPFWFCNLRSEARWNKIQRQCPGIGRGRHFTKEQILTIAGRTMLI